MTEPKIADTERSEEHIWDSKFVSRWADRCIDIYHRMGQQVANSWATQFFSPELLREVNKEIVRRKTGGKK